MQGASIAIDDLACRRGDRLLFRGVSLRLDAGEALQVTGRNGIGKSSLLRILAGLAPAFSGAVTTAGSIGLVDERPALDPGWTLGSALAFWQQMDGNGEDRHMARLGLSGLLDVPVRYLSTGQKKRAALARLLGQDARIWLLDEPLNGLDSHAVALVEALAARHCGDRFSPAFRAAGHGHPRPCGARGMSVRIRPLLKRDLTRLLLGGRGSGALLPILFFLSVAMLYPFSVGPDAPLLARTGGGVIWVAALLAAILPLDRLVEPDIEMGLFDQWALRGISEELVIAVRVLAHWLSFGPPLMLAALPAAALLGLDGQRLMLVEIGLLAGTPGLAALGVTVAALTAGLRGGAALGGLLMIPMAVPVLIFGAGSLGSGGTGGLALTAAASLVLLAIAPFASGAAIRAARG